MEDNVIKSARKRFILENALAIPLGIVSLAIGVLGLLGGALYRSSRYGSPSNADNFRWFSIFFNYLEEQVGKTELPVLYLAHFTC